MDTPTLTSVPDDTAEQARVAATEANMIEQGVPTHERVQDDYFGFDETHTVVLPDGVSYIEHKTFTEGDRKKYLNEVNRDVRLQKATGDALVRVAPGDERFALLKTAICGWNLKRNGMDVPCNDKQVREFLDRANPKVIDLIEKEVRKANPWLLAELSVEDIDKEIADLQELREKKVEEEEGKAASSSR